MLRVCVIGMGHIGHIHARAYRDAEEAELVGVCDINPERAIAAGKAFDVPYYLDALTMLKELKPDVCSVTTGGYEYSSDHYLPTIQALEAGCHVLGEKPISNDLRHAQEMVDTAARLNRCYAIDFNHRFTPPARQAEKWMAEGKIGELLVPLSLYTSNARDTFIDTSFPKFDEIFNDNGVYKWGFADERTLEGLKLWKQAYDEGLIGKEF